MAPFKNKLSMNILNHDIILLQKQHPAIMTFMLELSIKHICYDIQPYLRLFTLQSGLAKYLASVLLMCRKTTHENIHTLGKSTQQPSNHQQYTCDARIRDSFGPKTLRRTWAFSGWGLLQNCRHTHLSVERSTVRVVVFIYINIICSALSPLRRK